MQKRLFITGTDTGVGKTVLTALLAAHLRDAAALKPFCSGGREDAELLAAMTGAAAEKINPWFFAEPISPWSAARKLGVSVSVETGVDFIRKCSRETVLIEGAGGVLTPLGERFTAADLIRELGAEAILVAPNRLGVLNQVCLAARALAGARLKIALMSQRTADESAATNYADLQELLPDIKIVVLPFLSGLRKEAGFFQAAAGRLRAQLNELLA